MKSIKVLAQFLLLILLFSSFSPERYYLKDKGEGQKALLEFITEQQEERTMGQTPLVVIDGKPYRYEIELKDKALPLFFEEVETIDVLKRKTSETIYGESGKHGAIIITTKRAKMSKDLPTRKM